MADTLGIGGRYRDPLWRVQVSLTALEQELLRTWWVRRLGFVAHAGAAAMISTQTYSRLEHSLGLLALVCRFAEDDHLARTAALLHDIGHLPFSHTFEGVRGLDHHRLGDARIAELAVIIRDHGLDPDQVRATVEGRRPSVLRSAGSSALGLDHLDSFARSGQAHGRTRQPPHLLLGRLRMRGGSVDTDADSAGLLLDLITGEAHAQISAPNLIVTGVLRDLARRLLTDRTDADVATLATSTDALFWTRLSEDVEVGPLARRFIRDPLGWTIVSADRAPTSGRDAARRIDFRLRRLYLGRPTVDGHPIADPLPAGLPQLPADFVITESPCVP